MFSTNGAAEHIELESPDSELEPTFAVHVLERIELRDRLRRITFDVALFAEDVIEIRSRGQGRTGRPLRLALKHLDARPILTRQRAKRTAIAAAAAAAVAAVLGTLAVLLTSGAAAAAAVTAALAATACLLAAARRSGETSTFVTLNGRVPVLELSAGFGAVHSLRKLVPRIVAAIEAAAAETSRDTGAFLRGEMREHYRLRGESVLTDEQCATGTSRILTRFDTVG